MQEIVKYIKENKWYLIVMLIGTAIFILQMKEVVLYADDFHLMIVSKGGIKAIIDYFKMNYMNWAGGLTCIFATIFLMFDITVWKIFHCILVIGTIGLSTKMICKERGKNKALVSGVMWLCLFSLNILVSREVLYWLDGGLAYMLTAFQIFIYFYYLYTRLILNINKKYDKFLLPIIAFFAGWSSAQTGPMTAIFPLILLIWKRKIMKEKINKIYYFTIILGLLGFAIFYFAPGNSARLWTDINFRYYANLPLYAKVIYRCENIYEQLFDFKSYTQGVIPNYLFLTMGIIATIGYYISKNEKNEKLKKKLVLTSGIQIAYLVMMFIISLNIPHIEILTYLTIQYENLIQIKEGSTFSILWLIPYIISTIILITIVVEAYLITKKDKNPFLITIVFLAFIMQLIMVMAPYSPLRTTFYTILFLWIAIAYLVNYSKVNKIDIGIPVLFVVAIQYQLVGIILIITYLIVKILSENIEKLKELKILLPLIIIVSLCFIAGKNAIEIIAKYKANKLVYNSNVEKIFEYKENKDKDISKLELKKPIYMLYGFDDMTSVQWTDDLKKCYEIDESVEIIRK